MSDPILDPLRRELTTQLLRHAVGRAIFCPGAHCGGQVLDVRRAVLLDTVAVCTTCWGALDDDQRQSVVDTYAGLGRLDDLVDGPALHGLDPVIPAPTSQEG